MAKDVMSLRRGKLFAAQQAAQMRLQLYITGRTHALLLAFARKARGILLDVAGGELAALDGVGMNTAIERLTAAWAVTFRAWQRLFESARRETALLPFGRLAVEHELVFAPARKVLAEAQVGAASIPFYEPQLQALLDAANQRLYGDGFKLSQRIWRLDQDSLEGIRRVVYQGVVEGRSAWQIAEQVEQFLGAGQDCPRWTDVRLYGLTKQDIADGDRTGLFTKEECVGQGVAYNALRLARTELQYVHALAHDAIAAKTPWVEMQQVHLSPSHPDIGCVCEEIVAGGEKGDGVYPKGELPMQRPFHPHCLCWVEDILMEPDAFVARLHGWVDGSDPWPGMDEYARWVGMNPKDFTTPLLWPVTRGLQLWLWGSKDELDKQIDEGAEA